MSRYDTSFYNRSEYLGESPPVDRSLTVQTVARIVRARPAAVPPVIDTWYNALAHRFDYLQMAIQVFGQMNKIQYAKGSDLDNIWGKIYNLPRLTGESDENYRSRLQTYTSVLVGCGGYKETLDVLNFLAGVRTGVTLGTVWPARVIISSDNVDVLRNIKNRMDSFQEVLPKLFAAGIDWEIQLSYLDYYTVAYIAGDRSLPALMRSAIRGDSSIDIRTSAAVSADRVAYLDSVALIQADVIRPVFSKAAIVADRIAYINYRAAVLSERMSLTDINAAISAERDRTVSSKAAVRADRFAHVTSKAALAKTFEKRCNHIAWIVGAGHLDCYTVAAVRGDAPAIAIKMRARIAKPKGEAL
jgi:hypothetical protein